MDEFYSDNFFEGNAPIGWSERDWFDYLKKSEREISKFASVYSVNRLRGKSLEEIATIAGWPIPKFDDEYFEESDAEFSDEHGKVLMDRPDPLGGNKIEGPIVEEGFFSFVSQYPIPYLYGLTCGELAMLLNGEGMLDHRCNLHVVAMEGWKRGMTYEETGLEWIPSSPHIPEAKSTFFYPASGILGELGYMSIGVGYTIPFQMFAAEWIDADRFAEALNGLSLPGVIFRPIHARPFYSIGQGKTLHGVQLHVVDPAAAALSEVQFYVMQVIAELYPDRAVFAHADSSRFRMLDQVAGSDYVRKKFSERNRFEDIQSYWRKDADRFRAVAEKYYLYK